MLPGSKRGERGMGGKGRGATGWGGDTEMDREEGREAAKNVCLQFTCRRVSEMIRTSLRPWSLHRQSVNVSCLCRDDNLRTLQHPAETHVQTRSHTSSDSCTEQFSYSRLPNRDPAQGTKNSNNKTPMLIFLIVGRCQHSHRLNGECHSSATQANWIIYTSRQSI